MNQPVKGKHLIRVNTPCMMASGAAWVTVEVQEGTTVGDVKKKVLKRFKPGLVDPNLFTISVLVDSDNTHSCFVLRDDEELLRLQHLWRNNPATYSLDAGEPIFVKIHTGKVFPDHVYKTLVVAEETNSLEALRILFQSKKRYVPENHLLVRQDLRDFSEYRIEHSEPLSIHCRGPYAKIILKKSTKTTRVNWDDKHLISFIGYESPDEGVDDESSEQGSTDSSILDAFTWISDSVVV